MARSWTGVRTVDPDDWDALHDMWAQATADGGQGPDLATRPVTRERLEQILTRPCVLTAVAHQEDRLVGFMVATTSPLSGLTDAPAVTVEMLYVAPGARGKGVGRLLLAKAALLSEQTGASYVTSNVPGQARDLNRFFARLGFTATVTRRLTTPAELRRRLSGEDARPLERVLARRRSQRARTGLTQPLPVLQPGTEPRTLRVS